MNPNQLLRLFPNASKSLIHANCDPNPRPIAKLESNVINEPLAKTQVQKASGKRDVVRVQSKRRRLLDEDNLCAKFLVDCIRYSGILLSDAPGKAQIIVSQEKVGSKEPEEIIVTINKSL